MKNNLPCRFSADQGLTQSVNDEGRVHFVGDSPADQFPGMQVDHGGHVSPALPRLNICDVATPLLVRFCSIEHLADQVRGVGRPAGLDGGLLPGAGAASLQALLAHKPPDPLRADRQPRARSSARTRRQPGRLQRVKMSRISARSVSSSCSCFDGDWFRHL